MSLAEAQPQPEDLPAPPSPKARRLLRNYLLDTGLQLRLASYLVGVATLLSIFLGVMLWRAYREASQVMQLKLPPGLAETFGHALDQEDQRRIFLVVGALVLVNLFLLLAAVLVTHRIAGPAYAVGRTCRRVAEGDLTEPPPLRSRDLLGELGEEVAHMVRTLRGREAKERDLVTTAARVLRDPFAPAQFRQELAQELEKLAAEKERRLGP
jgi:methyl-accepting chemotaxis protein